MNGLLCAALATVLMAACAPARGSAEGEAHPDRDLISLEQVQAARVDNAYELVRKLHPIWLRKRGANSVQNDGDVVVYLNDTRLGGPEALRQVETITITSIRFFGPGPANFRFGTGHHHGAIQVSTKVPLSTGT
jgi:hypothetical protein